LAYDAELLTQLFELQAKGRIVFLLFVVLELFLVKNYSLLFQLFHVDYFLVKSCNFGGKFSD